MKLRLKQNTIRIRLDRDEVKALTLHGSVQSQTRFSVEQALKYQINLSNSEVPTIEYRDLEIVISLPTVEVKGWNDSERVGFAWDINLNEQEVISFLIEKDFKCLTARAGEDESNLFENPNESHA